MKKIPPYFLLVSLGLATLGQCFMARQEEPWTAWCGAGFYLASILLFLKSLGPEGKKAPWEKGWSARTEAALVVGIMALALFFRTYRIQDFPAGIFPDDACAAEGALRILREGWRPFGELFQRHAAVPSIYYELSLWFLIFPATKVGLFSFSILLSLATLLFVYGTFRQLAGPRVALLTLFILAVMRWNFLFSRNAHLCVDLPFYVFGTLFFWVWGLRTGKGWAYAASAVLFAAGTYSYTAYYIFIPLMVLYAVYEWSRQGKNKGTFLRRTGWSLLLFSLLSFPMARHLLLAEDHGNILGAPQDRLHTFLDSLMAGDFTQIPGQLLGTAFLFIREGDTWFLHNLPRHRMLDDVTAALLVLGLALALRRIRVREHFYAAAGFLAFCLPAFLSASPAHASRAYGATPFAAFLAAYALSAAWKRLEGSGSRTQRRIGGAVLAAVLGSMVWQNFDVYFHRQARDQECWRGPATDATYTGKRIADLGDRYEYYLSPRFTDHYAIRFLGHSQSAHVHELELPQGLSLKDHPRGQGAFFALSEGRTGVLRLLETLYPGGEREVARDLEGNGFVYFYRVSPEAVEAGMRKADLFLGSKEGLRAQYRLSGDWKAPVALTQIDPVINFTFRNDFPVKDFPPLCAHWSGSLAVPAAGSYRLLLLTTDAASVKLDGKPVRLWENTESEGIPLARGLHALDVYFLKSNGTDAALSLLWKKPGDVKFEVIPHTAYQRSR